MAWITSAHINFDFYPLFNRSHHMAGKSTMKGVLHVVCYLPERGPSSVILVYWTRKFTNKETHLLAEWFSTSSIRKNHHEPFWDWSWQHGSIPLILKHSCMNVSKDPASRVQLTILLPQCSCWIAQWQCLSFFGVVFDSLPGTGKWLETYLVAW